MATDMPHVRAAILGPSLSMPVSNGELLHGTWQQIVLIDFDNRPREKECTCSHNRGIKYLLRVNSQV